MELKLQAQSMLVLIATDLERQLTVLQSLRENLAEEVGGSRPHGGSHSI